MFENLAPKSPIGDFFSTLVKNTQLKEPLTWA